MTKQYLYDRVYTLIENCNITWTEAWNIPVEIREYWLNRKAQENEPKTPEAQPKPNVPPKKVFIPDGPAKGLV